MKSYNFRMVEMQIMNVVNVGISYNIPLQHIEILANALIDATQLFLEEDQVDLLKSQLDYRIKYINKE